MKYILFSTILIFISCSTHKTTFSERFDAANNKVAILELEPKKSHLSLNKSNVVLLKIKNINREKIGLSACGLIMNREKSNDSIIFLEITPKRECLKIGKWQMILTESIQEDSLLYHKFLVPVKLN